jgi:hypothetical protein
VIVYSLGNFVSAMYTRECRQSIIFNIDLARNSDGLAPGSVSFTPVYRMNGRTGGEKGAYVVDILMEVKKTPGGKRARELAGSYRDLIDRLGGNER